MVAAAAAAAVNRFQPPSYTAHALGGVTEKKDDVAGLDGLRQMTSMMKFGQILAGAYSKCDMSTMPDAAAAMQRTRDTAAAAADMGKAVGNCLDKDGRLKPDLEDAKASAMTMFLLAEHLVIESYTAVRLLKEKGGAAGGRRNAPGAD